jgi:hypothetical protein
MIAEIDRLHSVVTSLLAFARPVQLRGRSVDVPDLLLRTEQLAREEIGTARFGSRDVPSPDVRCFSATPISSARCCSGW